MKLTIREKEKKPLPNRCCLSASGTVERSRLQLVKLSAAILAGSHRQYPPLFFAGHRVSQPILFPSDNSKASVVP
jgi:hypothetical protein